LTPELGSSVFLPLVAGMARAKEIFMLGDWFTAAEAKEVGLVNRVVAPHELMAVAMQLAERLAAAHPEALRLSKQLLNRALREKLEHVLEVEDDAIREAFRCTGGPAGVARFQRQDGAKFQRKGAMSAKL
jgi:enoyl-CoA hydratase/carnithine racemase